jgi:SAM-dependent methyltransferase
MSDRFDKLVNDALMQELSGWDFSYLTGRWLEGSPSWDYRSLVEERMQDAKSLLDMGTGGGEFLASLRNLPADTSATECYPPNIPIAEARLNPIDIQVYATEDDAELPFADNTFDLIINRHEAFSPEQVHRILKPSGLFITQQVGGMHCIELNHQVGNSEAPDFVDWSLGIATEGLRLAGFEIQSELEEHPITYFRDIGAIVYYLRKAPWQIPSFDTSTHRDQLLRTHLHIERQGTLAVRDHYFYIECCKC